MLVKNIFNEFKIWHIVRKTVKENHDKFNMLNFDVDWLGRVYTVINIPDEIMTMPEKNRKDIILKHDMIDKYIKNGLEDINELFTTLCISDLIIYPNVYERFENTDSVLLILAPERKYTKLWLIITYAIAVSGIAVGLSFLISYLTTLI